MEKILFRKIELWIVLLLGILGIIGLIFFGSVLRSEYQGFHKYGALGRFAVTLAELPANTKKLLKGGDPMAIGNTRFGDRPAGWSFAEGARLEGYVLLSRHDVTRHSHVVELYDLAARKVVHSWWPDADSLLEGARIDPKFIKLSDLRSSRFRAIHPVVMENGDLIVHDHTSPLVRVDACARLVWRNDDTLYHHSTERAGDGSLWLPNHNHPSIATNLPPGYVDDGLAHVSADGELLETISITQALVDAGYAYLIFPTTPVRQSRDYIDMIHVNDIQPVMQDGPYWKKGDLFVSTRHYSMVILYRPSERRIVWMKNGPWASQHDVEIIDDHTIAVFNNNVFNRGVVGHVEGVNDATFYDFATDTVSSPFKALFEREEIKTLSGGLFDMMPGGGIMIEEENHGRIVFADKAGKVLAEFINRAEDGMTYHLGWSRYIPRAEGDAVAAKLAGITCADDA